MRSPLLLLLRRRDSGPVLSGLVARYRANEAYTDAACTTQATADGALVMGLKDLTGNGRHATRNASDGTRPVYRTGGGIPYLEGNGINRYLDIPSSVTANRNSVTLVAVMQTNTPSTLMSMMDLGPNHWHPQLRDSQFNTWKWTANYQPTGLLPGTAVRAYHLSAGTSLITMSVDGNAFATSLVPSSGASAGGYLLRSAANQYWNGKGYEWLIYDRQLTAAEIRRNEAYFKARYGSELVTPTKNLIYKGDSITQSATGPTIFDSYPAQVLRNTSMSPKKIRAWNLGVSSQTLATMITNYPTEIAPLYDVSLGANGNILVLFAGTNDLAAGATGATVYSRLQSYCTLARATGFKIIIASPIDRTEAGLIAGWETERQNLRTLLSADSSFADAYVDAGADASMGLAGTSADATYFQADKTHPNDTGQAHLATLFQSSVDTLLVA